MTSFRSEKQFKESFGIKLYNASVIEVFAKIFIHTVS